MTSSNATPDIAQALARINRRLDQIERRLNAAPGPFKSEVSYSYSGALTVSTSPPFTLHVPEVAFILTVLLGTAGSSGTVVSLTKNGATVATVTLASGIDRVTFPLSVYYAGSDQDVGAFVLSTAGSGALDLSVIARFKPAPTG